MGVHRRHVAAAQAVLFLDQHDDRASLRRFVAEARELGGIRQLALGDARQRHELGCLTVAERDRAGLVEVSTSPAASTARPDMANTLKRTSRSMPAMPIAESSAPMVVGISVTNSATSTTTGTEPPAYAAKLGIVATASTKMMVMPASRMLSAISFGVFCRLAPSTSPIIRGRSGGGGDAHPDLVGQHLGAAGDRRPVAAALADDRSGWGSLGTLRDLAVAGDRSPASTTRRRRPELRGRYRGERSTRRRQRFARFPFAFSRISACALPRPRTAPRSWRTAR